MSAAAWTALAALPAGIVAGLLLAPILDRYVEDAGPRRRLGVAVVMGTVFAAFGLSAGPDPVLAALLYLGAVGTLLSFVDAAVRRLPDALTLRSYVVAPILLGAAVPVTDEGARHFVHALIGMVALGLVYGVQHFAMPRALGMGDVKLSGVLGLYLGWFGEVTWLAGLLLTMLLAGVAGVGTMIVRRTVRGSIPFGPYMIAGAFLAIVAAPLFTA